MSTHVLLLCWVPDLQLQSLTGSAAALAPAPWPHPPTAQTPLTSTPTQPRSSGRWTGAQTRRSDPIHAVPRSFSDSFLLKAISLGCRSRPALSPALSVLLFYLVKVSNSDFTDPWKNVFPSKKIQRCFNGVSPSILMSILSGTF